MTIDAAIAEISVILEVSHLWALPKEQKGLKLGIEALKRLKEHREEHIDITFRALPGETTD